MDIIIGKEGNQPFQIPDPLVSRRHACLRIDDYNKELTLTDLNSANGTSIYNGQMFVRLYPNTPCKVTYDTMIQLGPNTRFHVRKLFDKPAPPKPIPAQDKKTEKKPELKKADIKGLRLVSERYQKQKMNLDGKLGTINSMRSATVLVSLTAGTGGKLLAPRLGFSDEVSPWIFGILIAAVLIGTLLMVISSYSKKLKLQITENERDYAIRYVCPECHTSFRGKFYQNILAEGCCPRCKTKYYDSNIKK